MQHVLTHSFPTRRSSYLGASVILLGSLAARRVLENHAVYAGSKAAILAFARSWALELKARRIRVNVLSPGPVHTTIQAKRSEEHTSELQSLMRISYAVFCLKKKHQMT